MPLNLRDAVLYVSKRLVRQVRSILDEVFKCVGRGDRREVLEEDIRPLRLIAEVEVAEERLLRVRVLVDLLEVKVDIYVGEL